MKAPKILATSQQSRFHTETLDANHSEVDLKGVTVSIEDNELVTDSRLKLKDGVRYALVGRNGTGKSTLLQALADKLVPGLGHSLRIILVSQIEDTSRALSFISEDVSVLQHVIRGDAKREATMREFNMLTTALESLSLDKTQRVVNQISLERLSAELEDARKIASRTSGARGKKARDEEIKAEARVKSGEETLAVNEVQPDVTDKASEMLLNVTTTLEMLDASTTESRAASVLLGLGFSQAMMNGPFKSLSGGWRSRCALATSLLVQSDILLLDEPSNFLDLQAAIWLEQYLLSQTRTLVLTSHDQVFLNNVVDETIILKDKTLRYFEGTPRAFEIDVRKRRKNAIKQQSALDRKKEHIEKSISQGIASGLKSGDDNRLRMAKSRQKKLDERWGLEKSAKGGRFKLNRDLGGYYLTARGDIVIEDSEPEVRIKLPAPEKLRTLGDLVHFDNVSFKYPGASQCLFENVTFTMRQGGRCVFVGANGQGKSTLAKLVLGELSPTKGTIVRHPLLRVGYFSQHAVEGLSSVLDSKTALTYFIDHFSQKGDKISMDEAMECLGTFGLGGRISSATPLKALSGGQKVRLAFALIVFHPPPLLLLDELTTHVDAPTIQGLARALRNYPGGIMLVTHDRWFSRVVVEGHSLHSAGAFGDDISEDSQDETSSSSSDDDDDRGKGKTSRMGGLGQTLYVGDKKVVLLEGGMTQYIEMVEHRLEKLSENIPRDSFTAPP